MDSKTSLLPLQWKIIQMVFTQKLDKYIDRSNHMGYTTTTASIGLAIIQF